MKGRIMANCRKRNECCLTCAHWVPYPYATRETFYDEGYYVSCNSDKVLCSYGEMEGLKMPQSYDNKCSFYSRDSSL